MLRNEPYAEARPVYCGRTMRVWEGGGPQYGTAVARGPYGAALLLSRRAPRASLAPRALAIRGLRGRGAVDLTAASEGTYVCQVAGKVT